MCIKIINPVMPVIIKKPPKQKQNGTKINKNIKKIKFNYNNYYKPLNLTSVKWNHKHDGF